MAKIFKKLKTDTLALPSKVVYYNNMNGVEYSTINVQKQRYWVGYSNADASTTVVDDFTALGTWGEAKTVKLVTSWHGGTTVLSDGARRGFVFQSSTLDNGFSTCKSLTLGGWFKPTDSISYNFQRIMWCSGTSLFGLWRDTDGYLNIDGVSTSGTDVRRIVGNTWIHFAMSLEETDGSTTFKVYVNGVLLKTYTQTYTMDFKTVQIGCAGTYCLQGETKNIFAAKGVLTEEEIRQMMLRD